MYIKKNLKQLSKNEMQNTLGGLKIRYDYDTEDYEVYGVYMDNDGNKKEFSFIS